MTTCPACGRTERSGLLCATCTNGLRRALKQAPELLAELTTSMAKQSRQQAQTDPTKGDLAHERLPIDLGAAAARYDLERALLNAARDQPAYCLGAGRAETAAAYLLAHLEHHRRDATTHATITHATNAARRAIDLPTPRTALPIGPCPDCDAHVTAYFPPNGAPHMTCDGTSPHTWNSTQWLRTSGRILRIIEARAHA